MSATPSTSRARTRAPQDVPGALDLLEEAAYLLRRLPGEAIAWYLAGTVPMVLGGLGFFTVLTADVRTRWDPASAALVLVALFTWMKTAQALAAEHAMAQLEHRSPTALGWRGGLALAAQQLRVQAVGLLALPLALVLVVPFAWVLAFQQNCTVLGVSNSSRLGALSWRQARLWPVQNHAALAILLLLGLFVFLNVALAIYGVPYLLRALVGADTLFAISGWSPFNTTFLASAVALTYLVVDPLVRAWYVLRCFHGHARHTGIDLLVRCRAALAAAMPPARAAIVAVGAVLTLLAAAPSSTAVAAAATADAVESSTAAPVDAASLDAALDEVLADPEYNWRLGPERQREEPSGLVGRFLGAIRDLTTFVRDALARWIERLTRSDDESVTPRDFGGLGAIVDWLVPVIIGLVVIGMLWLAWRWWAGARQAPAPVATPVVTAVDVVADERVMADQLPQDEWLRLGRELLERGELRLALRAFFLGSLAALAHRGLLVLARHKSNRDYERELARRGGAVGLTALFVENRRMLERAWYGQEPAQTDDVQRMEANVRQLAGGDA